MPKITPCPWFIDNAEDDAPLPLGKCRGVNPTGMLFPPASVDFHSLVRLRDESAMNDSRAQALNTRESDEKGDGDAATTLLIF